MADQKTVSDEPAFGDRPSVPVCVDKGVVDAKGAVSREPGECYNRPLAQCCCYSIAAAALVCYVLTLYPSVPPGDSGELITVAYKLGVAHPPGYPTFTMICHLFTYIPMGTIGWRVNLASAIFMALSTIYMFKTMILWTGSISTATMAQGLLAFGPLVWNNAVQAEVFSFHVLFVNALLYYTALYHRSGELRVAYIGAFVSGFALTNQHTTVLYEIPCILSVMIAGWRDVFRPRQFLTLAAIFLLALTPYLYFFITDPANSRSSWGQFNNFRNFLRHLLREEYGTLQLGTKNTEEYGGTNTFWEAVFEYGSWLPEQVLFIGPFFAVIGLARSLWDSRMARIGAVFAASLFFYLVVFLHLANLPLKSNIQIFRGIMARFYLQPNIIVIMWTAIGWRYFLELLEFRNRRLIFGFAVFIVGLQCALNYEKQDQSQNWWFHDKGVEYLTPLPKNAVVHLSGDIITNAFRYAQEALGLRPDVYVIAGPMMNMDWFVPVQAVNFKGFTFPGPKYGDPNDGDFTLGFLVDANAKFPWFFGGGNKPNDLHQQTSDGSLGETSPFWGFPEGGLERVYRTSLPPARVLIKRYKAAFPHGRMREEDMDVKWKYPKDMWENLHVEDHLMLYHNIGWHCLTLAMKHEKWGLNSEDKRELLLFAKENYAYLHKIVKEKNYRPIFHPKYVYHNKGIVHALLNERADTLASWWYYAKTVDRSIESKNSDENKDAELLKNLTLQWGRSPDDVVDPTWY